MNANQIAQAQSLYEKVALRACHDMFEPIAVQVGDILAPSYHWEDGETTDWVLNGTSGCEVSTENFDKMYCRFIEEYGSLGNVVLIAGNYYEYGMDNDEVIIRDAKVIAVA